MSKKEKKSSKDSEEEIDLEESNNSEEEIDLEENNNSEEKTTSEEDEISKLKEELEVKNEEIESYISHIQRLQADFDNYKKHVSKKESNIIKYANEQLIIKIIDVYEDLERAIASCNTEKEYDEGLNLIFSKFKNILQGEGLETIETEGQKFDPFKHEAMMVEDNPDFENNEIIDELTRGYSLKDKVIKYSKVRVCKKK